MADGRVDGEGMSSPGRGHVSRPGTPARSAYASSTPTAPMTRSSAPAARSGSPDAASDSASMSSTIGSRRCALDGRIASSAARAPTSRPCRQSASARRTRSMSSSSSPRRAIRLAHGDAAASGSLREGRQPGGELRPGQGQLVRHEVDHAGGVLGDRCVGGRLPRRAIGDRLDGLRCRLGRLRGGGRAGLPLTAGTHRRSARSNRERDLNGPSTASRAAAGSR